MKAAVIALAIVFGGLSQASASVIYDFEAVPLGTATPFVHPGAVTASFSSLDDPAFFVTSSFFSSLTGHVLLDADPPQHRLDIAFSGPVDSISLSFALNASAGAPSQIFILAYQGSVNGAVLATNVATGVVPPGFTFPEGSLSISGVTFNAVSLFSTAQDFAVDNIEVTTPVPEPTSLGLVLAGLASAIALTRHVQH
jgi:PEP-CTERM motif-containing protein